MRISDWSSDVCSSDLCGGMRGFRARPRYHGAARLGPPAPAAESLPAGQPRSTEAGGGGRVPEAGRRGDSAAALRRSLCLQSRAWHRPVYAAGARGPDDGADQRLARTRGPRAMTLAAVVMFKLGGPARPEAAEPFLFNMFYHGQASCRES